MKLKNLLLSSSPLLLALPLACSGVDPDTGSDGDGDEDNDAVLDDLGVSIDANGDGVADTWDADGDGVSNGVGVDTNRDGQFDAIGIDTDGDGIIDALDFDFDGVADPVTPSTGTGGGNAGTGGAGTGAAAGTGSAPATGGQGTGGTPAGGNGCASADVFCEDFESVAAGEVPSGDWSMRAAHCAGASFEMGTTTANVASGSQALRIKDHSFTECRITRTFEELDEFWLTAQIYWDPAANFEGIEMLSMDLLPDAGVGKDDPAVRFGNRHKEPCNETPGPQVTIIGIGGGEVTGCNNMPPIPKGEWYCFEAHVRQPDSISVKTYINDTELSYQSVGKPLVTEIESEGPVTDKLKHLRLGIFSHDSSGRGEVFLDDVSVSTTRVGCN